MHVEWLWNTGFYFLKCWGCQNSDGFPGFKVSRLFYWRRFGMQTASWGYITQRALLSQALLSSHFPLLSSHFPLLWCVFTHRSSVTVVLLYNLIMNNIDCYVMNYKYIQSTFCLSRFEITPQAFPPWHRKIITFHRIQIVMKLLFIINGSP